MTELIIIEKAIDEIFKKELGTTEQLLEIHEVVFENDKPKVLRIDQECDDSSAIVYFPIKDQKFYLAVHLDTIPEVKVRGVGTENYNSVYLKITSETFSFDEISSLTKLKPTGGWSKGDPRKLGRSKYNNTTLHFEPNKEPDGFEDKLKKLLDFLDQDKQAILGMIGKTNSQIQVVTVFHNGNTMLGGHHIDKETLKRISMYNLEIDFDLYAEGNFYKS